MKSELTADSVPGVLPDLVWTLNGANFDPTSEVWSYRDHVSNVSLDFRRINASADWRESAKKVLIFYAENYSPYTVQNVFSVLLHFSRSVTQQRKIVLNTITDSTILNYRSSLTARTMWKLGNLSGVVKKWHSMGLPGVSESAVALLRQLRIKGCVKGEAVLTMDPLHGPFSNIELQAIHDALEAFFDHGDLTVEEYVLSWLFIALGQRPVQYASLKVCDVWTGKLKDGTSVFGLQVPRAKQPFRLSRSEFTKRVLISKIGEKLIQHADDVRRSFDALLDDPRQAPLFPARKSTGRLTPSRFTFHQTASSLGIRLKGVLEKLQVFSERTGSLLNIHPTRFRRTVGTRAAMEGHGELVIAELLDHTDTQNVGVYVQSVPEIVDRIDRAMALHLAPMAQAFAGVIIDDESKAIRAEDPSSRICDPKIDPKMNPVGSCGKHGFCGYLAPIACYTCRSFQPWLDGPHSTLLDSLLKERNRLVEASGGRIATINDRTILAVAEVVSRCEQIRSRKEELHA